MRAEPHPSGCCRACGGPVACPPDAPRPRLARCDICLYLNVLDEDPVLIPLAAAGLEGLPREAARSAIEAGLEARIGDTLDKSRAIVARELPAATAFLLTCIDERDRRLAALARREAADAGSDPLVFNLATQLLYLLLCEHGGPDLRLLSGAASEHRHLGTTLFPLLTDAVFIPRLRVNVDAGYGEFAIAPPDLVLSKTADHTLLQEWQFNMRHWEGRLPSRRPLAIGDAAFAEAQMRILGFSAADALALMAEDMKGMARLGRIGRQGQIRAVPTDGLPEQVQAMLDRMTLTLARTQRFATPYHFDLGPTGPAAQDGLVPPRAIGMNWTAYYPLYRAAAARDGRPVVLSSPEAITNAFATLEESRSHMVARLIEAGRARGCHAEVAGIGRMLSAMLERAAAEAAEAAGFGARAGVAALAGRPLPCGEIDALAAQTKDGLTRIVVIEAKDVDLPLYKPGVFRQTVATIRHGAAQAQRKAAWVAGHWRDVAALLGVEPAQRAEVAPLLVTRRYVPPGLAAECPPVQLGALPEVLARLAQGRHEAFGGMAPLRVLTAQ